MDTWKWANSALHCLPWGGSQTSWQSVGHPRVMKYHKERYSCTIFPLVGICICVFIYVQEEQRAGHGTLDGRILLRFYCWAKIAGWKYEAKKHRSAQLFLWCLRRLWYLFSFKKSNFPMIMLENRSKLNLYFSKRKSKEVFFSIAVEFSWKQQLFSIFLTGNIIPIHWENTNEVIFSRDSKIPWRNISNFLTPLWFILGLS